MSTLYIVATPIGNLNDLSKRAIETLDSVNFILAEDTRRFLKLRSHIQLTYGLEMKASVIRFDEHTEARQTPKILAMLSKGNDIALVSDAGMPLISDPGTMLVQAVWGSNLNVTVIPGPSAISTALALSGLPPTPHLFFGYMPRKSNAKKLIEKSIDITQTIKATYVVFESPQRIIETLATFADVSAQQSVRFSIVVLNELTKKFEQRFAGSPEEIITALGENPRGEYVLLWRVHKN